MSRPLDLFLAAAPQPQRAGLRAMTALGRRPRGGAILRRLPPADQLSHALLTMDHYDDPEFSRPLGWDPDAVVARGRELRRSEDRP
jgi:hypothetical protein